MISLKQVKKDIESGKCKMIYYSSRTCWWTHDVKDLKESTIKVKTGMLEHLNQKKASTTDFLLRRNFDTKIKKLQSDPLGVPLDPSGAPLFQTDNPAKWIAGVESQPANYGPNGMKAFMAAHHQNCQGKAYDEWTAYPVVHKIKVGTKMWHRIFGWCLITHLPTKEGNVLVDSEYNKVKLYQMGSGWKTYEGENGNVIKAIFISVSELHKTKISDKQQFLINGTIERYKLEGGKMVRSK